MSTIHWKNSVDGAFAKAKYWVGKVVPGSADDAVLDAGGAAFTVTSSKSVTVDSIELAANATLNITGGTFSATTGTGVGANAGTIGVYGSAKLEVGGVIDNIGVISINNSADSFAGAALVVATNVTLTGGGTIELSDNIHNRIAGSGVSLVNVDNTISGVGYIGGGNGAGLSIVNETLGTIDATGTSLEIGSTSGKLERATVTNDGLIEATNGGGLYIGVKELIGSTGRIVAAAGSGVEFACKVVTGQSLSIEAGGGIQIDSGTVTVDNSCSNAGILETQGGVLSLNGAVDNTGRFVLVDAGGDFRVVGEVTGSGSVLIYHGTFEADSTFSQNVTFGFETSFPTGSKLILGQSQMYTGQLTAFSFGKLGKVSPHKATLDLRDIGFVSASEATFSGSMTSGVLTVTDGTHTADITLVGDYRAAVFAASADAHGGTDIIVSAVNGVPGASVHTPVAALAAANAPVRRFVEALASLPSQSCVTQSRFTSRDTPAWPLAAPRLA